MKVTVPSWMPMKVVLELDNATAGALYRAVVLVNSGQPISSDYGASLTMKDLEAKLLAMFSSSIEGHRPSGSSV